jgi:glycerol uptake facilitator-like aquaporin
MMMMMMMMMINMLSGAWLNPAVLCSSGPTAT